MDVEQLESLVISSFLEGQASCGFDALFDVFYPRAMRFFRVRGLDRQTCEDLTQNVFLCVFRYSQQVRDPAKFRAWLFRIVRNEWLQHQRRLNSSFRAARTEPLSDHQNLSAPALSSHLAAEVEDLLQPLTEDEREIVRLHFFDGLAYREIAELLGIALGTVKWKVFQIRAKLAEVTAHVNAEAAGRIG